MSKITASPLFCVFAAVAVITGWIWVGFKHLEIDDHGKGKSEPSIKHRITITIHIQLQTSLLHNATRFLKKRG